MTRLLWWLVTTNNSRLLASAWALGACLLVSAAAKAQAQEDPTATAAARERFKEGVAYFDQKQYEKARAAFVQAYALKKHPAVLLNLAQSELRSSHERDAAKHFSSYLRDATDASAAEREAAQVGLAAAKLVVGEIQVAAETGGEVFVDGTSEGIAPLPGPIFVDAGSHTLELKKGGKVASQSVSLKPGDSREVKLALSAEGAPAAPAPGGPAAATNAPAAEPESGTTEPAPARQRESFAHWVTTSPAGVIPAGATVLLGLGAGGFAIASNSAYKDADEIGQQIEANAGKDSASTRGICSNPEQVLRNADYPEDRLAARAAQYQDACAQHQDSADRGDSFKTFAIVSGIGAGVLAVTTAVLYFVTASDAPSDGTAKSPPPLWVVPSFAPGTGTLNVVGRF
jgi:hypothetical protein